MPKKQVKTQSKKKVTKKAQAKTETKTLSQMNANWKNKRPLFQQQKRFSPIQEKPVHPKNWRKVKMYRPWTPFGLVSLVGFLEQAPGGTLRGTTIPGPSQHKVIRPINKHFYETYKPR